VAFPPDLLNSHEELVLDLRPHWWFFARSTAALIGALILGGLFLGWSEPSWMHGVATIGSSAILLFCLGWFGFTYIRWSHTNFVLTTDRIITRRGFISKQGIEIPLDRVNTVFFHQTIFERLVGAGDLAIESASETGAEKLTNIRRPSVVQKEIYVQIEANENRKYDRMHAAGSNTLRPDATTPQPPGIPEQIAQLSELHQRGVLSDTEFMQKKAELLDRM